MHEEKFLPDRYAFFTATQKMLIPIFSITFREVYRGLFGYENQITLQFPLNVEKVQTHAELDHDQIKLFQYHNSREHFFCIDSEKSGEYFF